MDYKKLSEESLEEIKKEVLEALEHKQKDWRDAVIEYFDNNYFSKDTIHCEGRLIMDKDCTIGNSAKWSKFIYCFIPCIWVTKGVVNIGRVDGSYSEVKKRLVE